MQLIEFKRKYTVLKNNFNNFKRRNKWHNENSSNYWTMSLLNAVTKTIKNETKKQKGGFLSTLLGTLGASLLGNVLVGKVIVRAGSGKQWDL